MRFLTTSAAARRLGIAEPTLRGWADRGRVEVVRAGRVRLYPEREIERLEAERRGDASSKQRTPSPRP